MKKSIFQAAVNYLNLRDFKIIELNYSSSKYKIDVIASKGAHVYFIKIVEPTYDQDFEKYLNESKDRWLNETKYSGKFKLGSITIDPKTLAILGFNT